MAGEIYYPLIHDMTWSHSRLQSFSDCPYRWYLRYIRQLPGEPMFFASYGSFIHGLLDRYYSGELSYDALLPAYLTGFRDAVQGRPPSHKVFSSYFLDGQRFFSTFRPLPYKTIQSEQRIACEIDGAPFICILDHIGQSENGLVITDHKSRKLSPRSRRAKPTKNDRLIDDYMLQLYRYAEPVRQAFGEYPAELALDCFRSGIVIRETFDKTVFRSVREQIKPQIEKIEQTERFGPNIEYFKCMYLCEMHGWCDYCRVNFMER